MIYVLAGIITLVTISLVSNLQFEFRVRIDDKNNHTSFIVRLFGGSLIRHRFNFTLTPSKKDTISLVLEETDLGPDHQALIEDIIPFFAYYYKSYFKYADQLRYLIPRIYIKNLHINIIIGLGDAAQTALASGSLLTLFGLLKRYLKKNFKLGNSHLGVLPDYKGEKFNMTLDCIINVKLGYIIITRMKMFLYRIRGGEISGRTSYRKYHDNHYGKY